MGLFLSLNNIFSGPRGTQQKKLQNLDSTQLEGEPMAKK